MLFNVFFWKKYKKYNFNYFFKILKFINKKEILILFKYIYYSVKGWQIYIQNINKLEEIKKINLPAVPYNPYHEMA